MRGTVLLSSDCVTFEQSVVSVELSQLEGGSSAVSQLLRSAIVDVLQSVDSGTVQWASQSIGQSIGWHDGLDDIDWSDSLVLAVLAHPSCVGWAEPLYAANLIVHAVTTGQHPGPALSEASEKEATDRQDRHLYE